MKSIMQITCLALLTMFLAHAQRGTISIPPAASMTIPLNAQVCADTIFANGATHGTLTIANASCLCAGVIVTPVELLSFSAMLDGPIVRLQWQTASETNCRGFEVQRSENKDSWRSLGFVEGHGTTTLSNLYRYEDIELPEEISGVLYHRLKIIDTDGSVSFSPIAEISIDEVASVPTLFDVFPNPASDCATIQFSLPNESTLNISLYTIDGREAIQILNGSMMRRGSYIRQLSLKDIPAGIYLIELATGKARIVKQIVVKR